jgi:hypothetical protein
MRQKMRTFFVLMKTQFPEYLERAHRFGRIPIPDTVARIFDMHNIFGKVRIEKAGPEFLDQHTADGPGHNSILNQMAAPCSLLR